MDIDLAAGQAGFVAAGPGRAHEYRTEEWDDVCEGWSPGGEGLG